MHSGYRLSCVLSFCCGVIGTVMFTMFFQIPDKPSTDVDVKQSLKSLEYELRQTVGDAMQSLTVKFDAVLNAADMNRQVVEFPSPAEIQLSEESNTEIRDITLQIKKVKILCWVLTGPTNHKKRAIHLKRTWGRRCDKLLFISSKNDTTLPTTVLKGVHEGRKYLWQKTRRTFQLLYEKYLDEADFFVKADDDTYIIVENLKYLLKDYNSSVPYSFGCHFSLNSSKKLHNYHSGGAGYILTKEAVRRLVENGFPSSNCRRETDAGPEDLNLGDCLKIANVELVDTRDKYGRYRFLPYPPRTHLIPGDSPGWWAKYTTKYPPKKGLDCCSDVAISFHYINPKDMYLFEYLLYHLRPYGVHDFGGEDDNDNQTLTIEKMK